MNNLRAAVLAFLAMAVFVAVVNACGAEAPDYDEVMRAAERDSRGLDWIHEDHHDDDNTHEHTHGHEHGKRIPRATAVDTATLSKLPCSVTKRITEQSIRAHMRFISDSVTQGRFTGSDGELIAAKYIASRLEEAGVEPSGDNGTYFQKVPLSKVVPTVKGALNATATDGSGESVSVAWGVGYVGSTQLHVDPNVVLTGEEEVVFVGYGIVDSSRSWDDYSGVNVSGKVVLCLLGQPTSGVWEGLGMQWSARWNYKVAKAAELGAKGVIQVTTTESGYAFSSIIAQQGGNTIQSPDDFAATPVVFYSWISQAAANSFASLVNETWESWHSEANATGFKPRTLALSFKLNNQYSYSTVSGTNVVGIIKGKKNPGTAAVFSGHIDHFGVIDGSVYNGARDNAAGAAVVLATATAFADAGVRARDSLVFLFPTSEEHGLYGAKYFVAHHPGNITNISTNVNYDVPNTWGSSYDMMIIGLLYSNVGSVVAPWAVRQQRVEGTRMYAISDTALAGMVYRGDSYAFLMKGIPAVWPAFAVNYTSSYPYGAYQWFGYFGTVGFTNFSPLCYHMPCDKYADTIPLAGAVNNAVVGARIGWAVANSPNFVPTVY